MAETIDRLHKAEVIWKQGQWRSQKTVEHTTLTWVEWFNTKRLCELRQYPPCGVREVVLWCSEISSRIGETYIKSSPEKPERFNSIAAAQSASIQH
jgi:hypothetical protein